MKNLEKYEGIRFMTAVNNIVSGFMMFAGIIGSITQWERDPAFAIGGVALTIFAVLAAKSSIEVMTAIREIAINTRKGI